MLHITHAPQDAALAARLKNELEQAGYTVNGSQPGHILLALLSPTAWADASLQAAVFRALDGGHHVIPLLAHGAALPKLIDHLAAVDLASDAYFPALKSLVDRYSAPDAPPPMRVLTPKVRAANRRAGYWLLLLVVVWFVIAVILVGVFRVQAPTEEYNSIATFAQATINVYVGRNLPRTTEDALNFPLTVQAAPTAQRPLLVATATRLAGGRSATATPAP